MTTQTPNAKLLECLNEYFNSNGELKNFLYVKGFSELCSPLANKGYEIIPFNNANQKINGELVIMDFNDSAKYWKLNKSKKLKN